ncbi:hypothetical protein H9Q09_05085 [Aurantimonas sp. DM33-3]|uniref:hypothetical protein n=1 Tax=Aurantimonas sp. DM33-3 TaxID=2766955 RepID=UPI001651B8DA|nr:hypothetical protein [Aurantimonas sp. DM33-3]MBC6715567.1 hypothetical protein [Aurantimonas sp. DM33-3]
MLESDGRLRKFIIECLSEGWSPEQIGHWPKNGAEQKLRVLATDTIYASVYRASQKVRELWRCLLRRRRTPSLQRSHHDRQALEPYP